MVVFSKIQAYWQGKLIWLILLLGLVVRLLSLNQSLWLDETISFLAIRNHSFFGLLSEFPKYDFHPPTYYLLLKLWAQVFGTSEVSLRIPSLIAAVLSIYILYVLGRRLVSGKFGLLAALFLALNPLHIYYSQEVRMYPLSSAVVLLNLYFFTIFIKGNLKAMLGLALSNLGVISLDYINFFIFLPELIYLLINHNFRYLKYWLITFIPSFVISLFWLPIFARQLQNGSTLPNQLPAWKMVVGNFSVKTLILTFAKFIVGRINFGNQVIYFLIVSVMSCIYVAIYLKTFLTKFKKLLLILTLFLALPIFISWMISAVLPIYSYFRLLYTVPIFVSILALSILSLSKTKGFLMATAISILSLFFWIIFVLSPQYHREDWRGLTNFVNAKKSSESQVVLESNGIYAPLVYYQLETQIKPGLKVIPAQKSDDIVWQKSNIKDLYLIEYLADITDPQRLLTKKIKNSGLVQTNIYDFKGIGFVYHYQTK